MNRKQRRANSKTQPAPAELFARAVQSHRDGHVQEAERLYRQVLAGDPRHADSLHRLGVIAYQKGRYAQAETWLREAVAQNPEAAVYHSHLGLALDAQGKLEEALACCRTAIERDPSLADVHNNLGVLLMRLRRPGEAATSYRNSLALAAGLPEVHNNLGNALLALDSVGEAAQSYRKAVELAPDFADARANLGGVLHALGRTDEAILHFRRALEIAPEAASGQPDILVSLALAHLAQGDIQAAMEAVLRALALEESAQAKGAFVQCAKTLQFQDDDGPLSALLQRALCEGWDRPDDLAQVCAAAIRRSPRIAALMTRSDGPFDGDAVTALAENRLLEALLCHTPNLDFALERLLTRARRHLLREWDRQENGTLDFHAALARQCFINEYVFSLDDGELDQAQRLREEVDAALERGDAVTPSQVAAVASYFPLACLSPRLSERTWPPAVAALLVQQIDEPREERRLEADIPLLTAISDSVSRRVQAQYEENPYPRWITAGTPQAPEGLVSHLRRKFPHASIAGEGSGPCEILVAGCGTGRNAVETAQQFSHTRLLAVDLSRSSLGHAARKSKTRNDIEYAQADLLELGSRPHRFDLIEAVGVLHHLADPYAGWRVLLSLLKPGGFMLVGLYSAAARRELAAPRAQIAAMGLGTAAGDVRRGRQMLMQNGDPADLGGHPDFFTISTCRDLLFHVQEQEFSLSDIGAFLTTERLNLLGFAIEDVVLADYRRRHPRDPAATDLENWLVFETANPDCFSGMYQFWLQKAL